MPSSFFWTNRTSVCWVVTAPVEQSWGSLSSLLMVLILAPVFIPHTDTALTEDDYFIYNLLFFAAPALWTVFLWHVTFMKCSFLKHLHSLFGLVSKTLYSSCWSFSLIVSTFLVNTSTQLFLDLSDLLYLFYKVLIYVLLYKLFEKFFLLNLKSLILYCFCECYIWSQIHHNILCLLFILFCLLYFPIWSFYF